MPDGKGCRWLFVGQGSRRQTVMPAGRGGLLAANEKKSLEESGYLGEAPTRKGGRRGRWVKKCKFFFLLGCRAVSPKKEKQNNAAIPVYLKQLASYQKV